jgi:hypothetical protein
MKMLIRACYEAFVIVAEVKGVPRQRQREWCHGNIPVPVTRLRCRCKRKCDGSVSCDERWGAPGYRVPTGRRWCQARETTNVHGRIQHPNMHLIQHMHSFTGGRLEVIPSKRANGTVRVRCKVEEVDVLRTFVVEVVVHVREAVYDDGS